VRTLALAAALLAPGAVWADCAGDLALARTGLAGAETRIITQGALSEAGGRCRLTGIVLEQRETLKIEIAALEWAASGLETVLVGAPDGLSLDFRIDNARLVPQTSDPWMSYYLDLQNRRNVIDVTGNLNWRPEEGLLEVAEFIVDLPGANGLSVSTRVSGATHEAIPGRLSGFDALTLEALSIEIENEGYLDGLALGWILGTFASVPGDPETVVAATLQELQGIVADWPDDIFPAGSKAALTNLIAAGPLPWGRLEIEMRAGAVPLDRFVAQGLTATPYAPESMAAAWEGVVFDISFEAADFPE
jgi:hypothetical protein